MREGEDDEHEIVEAHAVGETPGQAGRRPRHAGQAIVAAGERAPAERDAPQNLGEGQGNHQQVGTAGAQREQAEQAGGEGGGEKAAPKSSQKLSTFLRASSPTV